MLCHFDFRGCRVGNVRFGGARFAGWTRFEDVEFTGYAIFGGATFDRSANFVRARFHSLAVFRGTTFRSNAMFDEAAFSGEALFGGARVVDGVPRPDGAVFDGTVSFAGATFARDVVLEHARVADDAAGRAWPSRGARPAG